MRCEDLKIVNLNITEDNYQYKALFKLCTDFTCMDIDMENLQNNEVFTEIKNTFSIEEPIEEIKEIIMKKVLEASKIESKISEGKTSESDPADKKIKRGIDSLSTS